MKTGPDALHNIPDVDMIDFFREWIGKKPLRKREFIPKELVKNTSLLPIIGYGPPNGFVVGAAISATEFLGNSKTTQLFTGQSVFHSVAPGYGFGLRIKMNKKDWTNIALDYGRGDGFSGVYFNIREAF